MSPRPNRSVRRHVVRGLAAVALTVGAIASTPLASALTGPGPNAPGGPGGTGQPPEPPDLPDPPDTQAGCASEEYVWKSSPRILVHTASLAEAGFSTADEAPMLDAIQEVVDQFNQVGATSAKVTTVGVGSGMFDIGTFNDSGAIPTIHVGFTADIEAEIGEEAGGVAQVDREGCTIDEAHILFPGPADPLHTAAWDFGSPVASWGANDFWDATRNDASIGGGEWFRPTFLHELLHTFDLVHEDAVEEFSFINHPGDAEGDGQPGYPWANRSEADSVRPLPFEVAWLRARYPASGIRREVAVLNHWYEPRPEELKAVQVKLCSPSTGSAWSPRLSAEACGMNGSAYGSTKVCPGSTVRARFALANYSTEPMTVTATLWLSKDEVWDAGDLPFTASETVDVAAAESFLWKIKPVAPGAVEDGTEYQPIIRVESEYGVTDWTPLRGTLTGDDCRVFNPIG